MAFITFSSPFVGSRLIIQQPNQVLSTCRQTLLQSESGAKVSRLTRPILSSQEVAGFSRLMPSPSREPYPVLMNDIFGRDHSLIR